MLRRDRLSPVLEGFKLKRLLPAIALVVGIGAASPVYASSIINFDTCYDGTASCNPAVGGAMGFTIEDGVVHATVYGTYRGTNAFGFNIAGPTDGLAMNVTVAYGSYSLGANDQTIGPLGSFEYLFDGPPPVSSGATSPTSFSFTISRDAGFLSPLDVFEANEFGFLAGGSMVDYFGRNTYKAGSAVGDFTPIPEPGSMLLLGSGLAVAWRSRRRATR